MSDDVSTIKVTAEDWAEARRWAEAASAGRLSRRAVRRAAELAAPGIAADRALGRAEQRTREDAEQARVREAEMRAREERLRAHPPVPGDAADQLADLVARADDVADLDALRAEAEAAALLDACVEARGMAATLGEWLSYCRWLLSRGCPVPPRHPAPARTSW